MAGLGIDSGAHQSRGGSDNGISGFWIDEVIELCLPLVIVARDTHDVLAVGRGEVRVGIYHGLPHSFSVVNVLAKDDGLCKAIGSPEKLGDFGGDHYRTLFEYEIPVEISGVVLAILNHPSVLV